MSAQTGAPRSQAPRGGGVVARGRHRLRSLRDDPNPLWMREMRQAARVQVTPLALAAITILLTLLVGAVGGVMGASQSSPSDIGAVLFHTFFSLAYFVVVLVGPALGANAIASEREGKTWEAVLLTGMRPEIVARGKFLSATTSIAMYVVMLAPVGALPFLFGGVTPMEVLAAFVILFAIAVVAVGFGLAVSAKMQSMRGALVLALLMAFPASGVFFSTVGLGGAEFVRARWPSCASRGPVWLPLALSAAPFSVDYLVFLVVLPSLGLGLTVWFLYEVTLTNLKSVSEDRSVGLKRWYLAASAALVLVSLLLFSYRSGSAPSEVFAGLGVAWLLHAVFGAYLFATEALGPSRRVEKLLQGAGPFRTRLRPGVVPTLALVRWPTRFGLVIVALASVAFAHLDTRGGAPVAFTFRQEWMRIALFAAYVGAFAEFLFGFTAFLRVRSSGGSGVRPILVTSLFLALVGPWLVAAILGLLAGRGDSIIVAAPSPVFVLTHGYAALTTGGGSAALHIGAAAAAAAGYLIAGLVFGRIATSRTTAMIEEHRAVLADADRRLAEEDAALLRPSETEA